MNPQNQTLGGMSTQSGVGYQQGGQQGGQYGQQQGGQQGQGCRYNVEHKMLCLDDAALILIDHQAGLFNLVRDIDVADLRKNVQSLARAAYLADIPVVVTTSKQDSFHGPLVGDLEKIIPDAFLVQRDSEINAWENTKFVQTIEKLNKKTLIMAGTLTNVCLALPAISAAFAGYKVYAVIDASGASSKAACKLAVARMTFAHVIITDTLAMVAELMKTYDRRDKEEWWNVFGEIVPRYRLLVDTFRAAEHGDLQLGQQGQQGQQSQQWQGQQGQGQYGSRGIDEKFQSRGMEGGRQEEMGGRFGGKEFKETRLGETRKYNR